MVIDGKQLLLCIELETTNLVLGILLALFTAHTAQDSLYARYKNLHTEGFCNIVVGTNLETLQYILVKCFCSEEYDRYLGICRTYLLCQGETILHRHHNIEHANIEFSLQEGFVTNVAIGAELGIIAFGLQILAKEHTQVLIVLA